MSIITITTDFGIKDYMLAAVKGSILKELPDARIIDVSNNISPFNLEEAAYVVKNVYPNFPEKTVHIIGVDALPNKNKRLLAAEIEGQYFLAADNGILSLIMSEIRPTKIVEITLDQYEEFSNFPTRDIFVRVACHLVRGGVLEIVGKVIDNYKELNIIKPIIRDEKTLVGTVIYIDNFGNVITNITKRFFEDFVKGRGYEIQVRNTPFNKINTKYSDAVKDFDNEVNYHGDGLVLFNSSNYLEIAIYKPNLNTHGSASTLFGLKKGDNIYVNLI